MSVFSQQVVWVTGASSGIGEAMAKEFVRRGARVILTARRADRLEALAKELNQRAGNEAAKILAADLSQLDSLSDLAKKALSLFGDIDVLFNNAGVSQRSYSLDTPFEIEKKMLELDLLSPIALTKAMLPHFVQKKSGRVIVTSSLMGEFELAGNCTYSCAKHGLNGYFYSLGFEMKPYGVDVQVLMPGFVKTEVSQSAITSSGKIHGKMDSTHQKAMTAEEFARKVFPKIEKGQTGIVIAGWEGVLLPVRRWFPSLYRKLVSRMADKLLKDRLAKST